MADSVYRLSAEKRLKNIQEKDEQIQNQELEIEEKNNHIKNQEHLIEDKDNHIENQEQRIQSLGLKNRLKRVLSSGPYRNELPRNFAKKFNEKGYLEANPDVAVAVCFKRSEKIRALYRFRYGCLS